MAEDNDLVRFLLGEMDDAELERFHDVLEKDPDKQADLKDLQRAMTAVGQLRSEQRPARPLLLRAAAILLAFFAGVAVTCWMNASERPARADSRQQFYDRYSEQPAGRSSLSRAMVALAELRRSQR
jgi:ferric-dicitrate binding protein FerR (iron transport regulator)